MDKTSAQRIVRDTFKASFDRKRFRDFVSELCNGFDEAKAISSMGVPDAFSDHIKSCQRLGTFESPEGELADILVVQLTESFKLERTRTALRDFVAHKLKRGDSYKEAGLVAFVAPDSQTWRFSYVRMVYETKRDPKSGKIKPEERLTPARRYSYLVGVDEECHTAQSRFLALLQNTSEKPTLAQIEDAFSVESVTKEFFSQYAALFATTQESLDAIVKKDNALRADFKAKNVSTVDFAKKLLGQIVFLYFLQKKGWLGVPKGGKWGDGPRNFMRQLADRAVREKKCLFNDVLEPLFYDTLATDRGHEAWCKNFACRIPFLNGGLFEPLSGYDWAKTNISFSNALFTNQEPTTAGDTGTGIFDVLDRYNFTVNEAEPLEKEVAIDPEMLGKVFENLIEENRRKGLGSFYTPREIVHYMCQESLINYLDTTLNRDTAIIRRAEVETLIREGEQAAHYETARKDGTVSYRRRLPKGVEKNARALDDALKIITVCDPAIGSGAFPVGMMTEVVRARVTLTPYFNDIAERTPYHFKRHAIQNSLYGVDIDPGAVEIAKLRLWLSLVVDEVDVQQIKPLPNLDYKIVTGNSLLGVEKNLFNAELFKRLEYLKPRYFDATDRKQKERFKQEIDDLIHELTNGKVAFDFEIYFSEVFHLNGGFDIVIANPPYLESRSPAFGDEFKDQLQEAVSRRWQGIDATKFIPRGADLLIYFFETGIRLVSPTGVVAFITQNAWLDTEYGKKFQQFLLDKTHVSLIVDSDFKHFDSIDGPNINTVISFFHGKGPLIDGYITFARFQRAFAPGLISSSGRKVDGICEEIQYRQYSYSSSMLRTTKWGMLLSMDDTVLDLLSILEKKAKPLGKIGACELSLGQGLNLTKDYYVSPQQQQQLRIDSKALIPILTSADGAPFEVRKTSQHLVNAAALTKHEIKALAAAGIRAFDLSSTSKQPPILIMPRGIGRHYCAINSAKAFSSSCVDVYSKPTRPNDETIYSLWAILNSSVVWLLREASGRKNLGGGMLKAEAVDLKEIHLFMSLSHQSEIKQLVSQMGDRDALDTVSEIDTKEHRAIDKIVFDHLGLSLKQQVLVVDNLRQKIIDRMSKSET